MPGRRRRRRRPPRVARTTLERMRAARGAGRAPVDAVVAQEARALLTLAVAVRRRRRARRRRTASPSSSAPSASCRRTSTCRSSSRPPRAARSTRARSATSTTRGTASKTPDEFRQHVGGVLSYLGASVSLRSRGIFLGAANALARADGAAAADLRDRCSRKLDAARRGVSRVRGRLHRRAEDRGGLPAAEPPRPAPRLRRPRVRPRSAAGVRAASPGPPRTPSRRSGRSRRRACRPASS